MEQYLELNRPDIPISLVETFPKTGRTWLKFLLGKYCSLMFDKKDFYKYRSWKFWEMLYDEGWITHMPCIIHSTYAWWQPASHIRLERDFFMKRWVNFLLRDPRDVVVSAYYYKKFGLRDFSGNIDSFVREDTGSLKSCVKVYNLWVDNCNIYRNGISEYNTIKYEDMVEDTEKQFKRLLVFMGFDIKNDLVEETLNFCKFEKMKAYGKLDWASNWALSFNKVRESKSTWRKELGKDTKKYMNEYISENLNEFYSFYK